MAEWTQSVEQPDPADEDLIRLLCRRDAHETTLVELQDGRRLTVFNIAWGYDLGDEHAHVTTNISPFQDGYAIDFFFTDEVRRVVDADTGVVLWGPPE